MMSRLGIASGSGPEFVIVPLQPERYRRLMLLSQIARSGAGPIDSTMKLVHRNANFL